MLYEKRLLVLGGNGSGCVRLERSSAGISAVLTVSNVSGGDFLVIVRDDNGLLTFVPNTLTRPFSFTLPSGCELSRITVIVASGERLLLSGTLSSDRLWHGNLEDEIKRARRLLGQREQPSIPPKRPVSDFFLDIMTPETYDDNRVAEVNYYRSNLASQVSGDLAATLDGMPQEPIRAPEPPPQDYAAHTYQADRFDRGDRRERDPYGVAPEPLKNDPPRSLRGMPFKSFRASPQNPRPEPSGEQEYRRPEQQPYRRPEAPPEQEYRRAEQQPYRRADPPPEQEQPYRRPEHMQKPPEPPRAAPISEPERMSPPHDDTPVMPPMAQPPPVLGSAAFYDTVRSQLEKLFAKNEHYGALERLLPESKWIRVDYDNKGKFYLVGIIGEPVRYICYGVPGKYSPRPPAELAGYCQWLAIDENNPIGEGFWVMYQDAVTGKSVL